MGKTTGQPLLKLGSQGDDVKKLQQSLINAGYDVGKTGADGIAGPKTLGSLYGEPKEVALSDDGSGSYVGTNAGTGEENVTEEVAQPPTFNHTPSDTVIAANKVLADQWNSMPGAYQSQWNSKINDYMSKIENRDPFSYNFNEDGLYQMYKDHYTQMGQMAMMDTMGQAAAMTGGYGNSYAQTVGQQAYNQQLAQLNNIIPDLYQMAYNRYRDEGQDLLNMYNMYMDRENQDYGRYQDNLNNWWRETEYLAGRADTEYERDYNSQWDSYTAESDAYWKEYNANYQEGRDAIEDQKDQRDWIAGMISAGFEPGDEDLAAAGMTRAEADALKNAYIASENNDGSTRYDNGGLTQEQVKELQKVLGVTVDGLWGSKSSKAAGGMTADEAWAAYQKGELSSKLDQPDNPPADLADIRSKLEGFTSNTAIENYLEGLESAGTIDHETALQLMSEYMDENEVYNDDGTVSYSSMVKSTQGWTVKDDGGINWLWGVDNNAILVAPNGEQIRLDKLVDLLVSEGMKKSDAKKYVKDLQKNLGI